AHRRDERGAGAASGHGRLHDRVRGESARCRGHGLHRATSRSVDRITAFAWHSPLPGVAGSGTGPGRDDPRGTLRSCTEPGPGTLPRAGLLRVRTGRSAAVEGVLQAAEQALLA